MTKEALKRATELEPLIANAKLHIDKWEKAASFISQPHVNAFFPSGNAGYSYLDIKHIPFEVAKAISLAGFRKELQQLEDEFNSL